MQETAERYVLIISKEKSNIFIYYKKKQPTTIENIQVAQSIAYLGTKINNKNCFKELKKKNKVSELANITYSVTARCCNRLPIGKEWH